eukprot:TRINITY_DN18596_c0_g1_i1.p1 TRINITY_DN18596_c0_g1~~TRINITY_DN18596_c0_g1_i1.p1  ORF type:complete len:339 (+),score=-0.33 TRINITY_DN18596_c0_g1_i1:59-1075(+)
MQGTEPPDQDDVLFVLQKVITSEPSEGNSSFERSRQSSFLSASDDELRARRSKRVSWRNDSDGLETRFDVPSDGDASAYCWPAATHVLLSVASDSRSASFRRSSLPAEIPRLQEIPTILPRPDLDRHSPTRSPPSDDPAAPLSERRSARRSDAPRETWPPHRSPSWATPVTSFEAVPPVSQPAQPQNHHLLRPQAPTTTFTRTQSFPAGRNYAGQSLVIQIIPPNTPQPSSLPPFPLSRSPTSPASITQAGGRSPTSPVAQPAGRAPLSPSSVPQPAGRSPAAPSSAAGGRPPTQVPAPTWNPVTKPKGRVTLDDFARVRMMGSYHRRPSLLSVSAMN